ncbi:DUF3801 domain-containing protein [Sedimentibacter sp. MB31-C6]|uniref:DUF3801 domain-containing protein n=1 Tax=Sedimentibacter sp. MB31-C6 TaxID=3109366 RepID=UPI002DDD284D|nr:DUF3801 domain-containing protein [Sedimentibacter sp. MB36-C1]WSI05118.1 DUF3801 domain-containing protein [Sedimentibacter sp. MB36-C1]
MNTGGDTSAILMGFAADLSKEGFKDISKLGGEMLKYLFLSLLNKLDRKLNTGEVNIKRLITSGEELVTLDLNDKDAAIFAAKAKTTGLTYAIFDVSKSDNKVSYVYKKSEAEIVNKILEKMTDEKVNGIDKEADISMLSEYIIGKDRGLYILDKESPNDYIQINNENKEILKTYIVDKDNLDDCIKIIENTKKDTLEVEININGNQEILNKNDFNMEEIQKRVNDVGKTFSSPEYVYGDVELEKLKEKINNIELNKNEVNNKVEVKKDRKTMKEIDDNIKEVRAKKTNKKTKEKTKTKEGRDR